MNENTLTVTERTPVQLHTSLLHKNLLSPEEFRKMGMRSVSSNTAWNKLLTPLLVLVAVAVLGLNAIAFKTNRANAALEAHIAAVYTQALPNTPMMADPLLLLEREKRALTVGMNKHDTQGLSNLLHEVGLAMNEAPFNSVVDFSWKDATLNVRFTANVTQNQQESALAKLKARSLDAKWLITSSSSLPILQIKKGASS